MTVWFRRRSPDCLHVALPYFHGSPRNRRGRLGARGRGATLGRSPGERKRERESSRRSSSVPPRGSPEPEEVVALWLCTCAIWLCACLISWLLQWGRRSRKELPNLEHASLVYRTGARLNDEAWGLFTRVRGDNSFGTQASSSSFLADPRQAGRVRARGRARTGPFSGCVEEERERERESVCVCV